MDTINSLGAAPVRLPSDNGSSPYGGLTPQPYGGLTPQADVTPGMTLKIPTATPSLSFNHTVTAGETLDSIAHRYGANPYEIRGANPDQLSAAAPAAITPQLPAALSSPVDKAEPWAGTKLQIPASNARFATTHTVMQGETIASISKTTGVNPEAIRKANATSLELQNPPVDYKASLVRKLGDSIARGEGGYESYNTGTAGARGPVLHSYMHPADGTVTGKTINEILDSSSLPASDTQRMFATGKYQTVTSTLTAAKDAMGLSGDEKYDANMQERVFSEYLLGKAGGGALKSYVDGKGGTLDTAQYAASKEWASIAAPSGYRLQPIKGEPQRYSDGTQSYYESSANHANMKSTETMRSVLTEINRLNVEDRQRASYWH